MSNLISNRSEILFLYDVKQCNPNGDPMDANRPRIDEETGRCLVTDVRLKRTVRDYLFLQGFNGTKDGLGDIFIRDKLPDDKDAGEGTPHTGQSRSKDYSGKAEFLSKFIDVRLFGGVSAPKKEAAAKAKPKGKAADVGGEEEESGEEKTDEKKDFPFHWACSVRYGQVVASGEGELHQRHWCFRHKRRCTAKDFSRGIYHYLWANWLSRGSE
ncbi:MAG: type I CRISPR-associated protein Cas7 [Saprospiraceae bacterium]|nr:type I CRISPR-associated protein Cas7 [Saprospiraceae bacterium]